MADRADKLEYRAARDGWVAGQRVAAGDAVWLTAKEAVYEPVKLPSPAPQTAKRKRTAAQVDPS